MSGSSSCAMSAGNRTMRFILAGDRHDAGTVPGSVIAYRHADPRFPFLREDSSQSAGRWNAPGELTHYFCDTPDGAWAEFLRHEEIRDPRDIPTIRRALWAVNIGETPSHRPDLPRQTLIGGPDTWPACQQAARQYREHPDGIAAPSAVASRPTTGAITTPACMTAR